MSIARASLLDGGADSAKRKSELDAEQCQDATRQQRQRFDSFNSNSGSGFSSGGFSCDSVKVKLELMHAWKLDNTTLHHTELVELMVAVFEEQGLLEFMGIEQMAIRALFLEIEKQYIPNPYHNFRHAFDVFSAVYYLVLTGKVRETYGFDQMDVLILLISAIAHDISHPGFNNAFLVATRHELAITYNDQSVLENFHVAGFFRLVFGCEGQPGHNILGGMTKEQVTRFRKGVVECVLATDMSKHKLLVSEFRRQFVGAEREAAPVEGDKKQLLMCILLKAGDISNLTRPFPQCVYWCERLAEEFFKQGDREVELGMQPAKMFLRDQASGEVAQAQLTIGFADFFAHALFSAVCEVQPRCGLLIRHLEDNLKRFRSISAGLCSLRDALDEFADSGI